MSEVKRSRAPLPQTSIGAHVRLLRRQRGMTQQALGDAIGVARSTVAFWETDRGDPDTGTLSRIGEVLDVPLEMFLTGMITRRQQITVDVDEAMLLELYRGCGVEGRLAIVRLAERLGRLKTETSPPSMITQD